MTKKTQKPLTTGAARLRSDLLARVTAIARKKHWSLRMAMDYIVTLGLETDRRAKQSKELLDA